MDALRQALADNENELAATLARRRTLAVEQEKLKLQIALCEQVCCDKEVREQVKTLIQEREGAEAAAAAEAAPPEEETVISN